MDDKMISLYEFILAAVVDGQLPQEFSLPKLVWNF